MISIQREDGPEPAPIESAPSQATEAAPDAHKKPMPAIWIPATLSVGLLIAAVYLGGRIVTANSHAVRAVHANVKATPVVMPPPPAAAPVIAAPVPPPVPVAQPKPAPPPAPKPEPAPSRQDATDEQLEMIDPHAGERYIQVGALDLKLTKRYIPHLRQAKFDPHVAPGPTPDLLRILIGPFPDSDALNATKTELDRGGFANFIRAY